MNEIAVISLNCPPLVRTVLPDLCYLGICVTHRCAGTRVPHTFARENRKRGIVLPSLIELHEIRERLKVNEPRFNVSGGIDCDNLESQTNDEVAPSR